MKYTHFIDRLNEILLTYQVSQLTNLNTAQFLEVQKQKEVFEKSRHNPKDIYPKDYIILKETLRSIAEHGEGKELSYDEVCNIIAQVQMKMLTDGTIKLFYDTIILFDANHKSLKLKERMYHKRWFQMLDALYLTITGTNPYHPIWKSWYTEDDVIEYGHIKIIKGQFRLEIIYYEADVLRLLTEGFNYLKSVLGQCD